VIFGPRRLPELGSAVGRALREFRQATSEFRDQVSDSASSSSTSTTATASETKPAPAAAEPTEATAAKSETGS
jgi:Sec-independent protein translocase protein TatA